MIDMVRGKKLRKNQTSISQELGNDAALYVVFATGAWG